MTQNTFSKIFNKKYKQDAPLHLNENLTLTNWLQKNKGGCKCSDCTEKNSFDDDIYIVIVGGTEYIKEVCSNYAGYKNVIWVLDEEVSIKDFGVITNTYMSPLVTKKFSSHLNLETCSTIAGLEYAKSLGAKKCLKVRSDMVFSPLHRFLNTVSFERLGFLYYTEYPYKNFRKPLEPLNLFLDKILRMSKNKNFITQNHVVDSCIAGPVNDLLVYFNYYEFPDEHVSHEIDTSLREYKLMFNYMKDKKYDLNNTDENLERLFQFFLPTLEENNVDLINLKDDYVNLRHLKKNPYRNIKG